MNSPFKKQTKKRSPLTSTVTKSTKVSSPYLKNVDFGGIPLDTNTLAGQWMTFSHMANHYRKLLNVKPRVDTGLVGAGGGSNMNLSINPKMLQSSKVCIHSKKIS